MENLIMKSEVLTLVKIVKKRHNSVYKKAEIGDKFIFINGLSHQRASVNSKTVNILVKNITKGTEDYISTNNLFDTFNKDYIFENHSDSMNL